MSSIIHYKDKYLLKLGQKNGKYSVEVYVSIFGISNCKSKEDAIQKAESELGEFELEYEGMINDYEDDYMHCKKCNSPYVWAISEGGKAMWECDDCGYKWEM